MPTSAVTTFSNTNVVDPFIDSDDAFSSMTVIRLKANTTFAAGTVLGEITLMPGVYGAYASGNTDGTQNPAGILRRGYTTDAGRTYTDGVMNGSTGVLTSASAGFTAADVGKSIVVVGAGTSGANLSTTIASYQSATQVTLTANSATAVSGATFSFGAGFLTNYDEWGTTGRGASMYTQGTFAVADLVGLDANAVTKLGGHLIGNSSATQLFAF